MRRNLYWPNLLAPVALLTMLAACNDASHDATDFSPEDKQVATQPATGGSVPTELSQQERSLALSPVSECNLERLDGERFAGVPIKVQPTDTMNLVGWVADSTSQTVPESFELRMIGVDSNRAWKVQGHTGDARQDVQELLGGAAGYANPGFSVEVTPAPLPHDTYRMYVVFPGTSGLLSCDNGRSVTIG